jgi:AcrR family transcriptional regulator
VAGTSGDDSRDVSGDDSRDLSGGGRAGDRGGTAEPGFQRARTAENKQVRALALLDAARERAARDGVRAVTLTQIAAAAGVHISAVRRYYESREEIFLRLTAQGWADWAAEIRDGLAGRTGVTAGELAAVLAGGLARRPLFCDLLAHAPVTLERQVSIDRVRAFKVAALDALTVAVTAITAAVPRLTAAGAQDLIAAVSALAANLWQVAHPPPTLAALYREDPRLAHAEADFAGRLTRLAEAMATGLLAAGP